MAKIKVYIQSSLIPLVEVEPVLSGDFEFKRESGRVYYRHESKDKFRFESPTDWAKLQPQLADECGEVTVLVDKLCGGTYTRYWEGVFTIFDSTVNYSRCWLEVKPKPSDAYTCLEEALKEEQNIFSSGSEVTVTSIGGTLEVQTCTNTILNGDCNDYFDAIYNPLDSCLANPSEWCLKENEVKLNGVEGNYNCSGTTNLIEQTTVWHREVVTVPCSGGSPVPPSFGSGWTLLTDDCAGSSTATYWRCPPNSDGEVAGDYTRGRDFADVLTGVVTGMGCGLTVKSDFFNVNPLGDAPVNGAYTYAADNLHNMTVHQKSDIKRKNAVTGSSSVAWDLKTEDFFADLQKIFNVWFTVDNGVLILEHYSFFTSVIGWDLSAVAMNKQVDYSGNENVKKELFYWSEENSSYAFKATPIVYDCGEEEKEQRCRLFSTDIGYTENPDNADKVSDEGFILVANAEFNGSLIIIDNNEPLRWNDLLSNLHPYGRLYKSGKINNVQQNFISWLPYIKQETFKTDYCCGQIFTPSNLITTNLTPSLVNGVVSTATHNVYTGVLELELIY